MVGLALIAAGVVVTYLANRNRNTNPFKIIQGIPVPAVIAISLMIVCSIMTPSSGSTRKAILKKSG